MFSSAAHFLPWLLHLFRLPAHLSSIFQVKWDTDSELSKRGFQAPSPTRKKAGKSMHIISIVAPDFEFKLEDVWSHIHSNRPVCMQPLDFLQDQGIRRSSLWSMICWERSALCSLLLFRRLGFQVPYHITTIIGRLGNSEVNDRLTYQSTWTKCSGKDCRKHLSNLIGFDPVD